MINELPLASDPNQDLLDKVEKMNALKQRLEEISERQSSIIGQLEKLRDEQFQAGLRMGELLFSEPPAVDAVNLINIEIEARGGEIKSLEDQLREIMIEIEKIKESRDGV